MISQTIIQAMRKVVMLGLQIKKITTHKEVSLQLHMTRKFSSLIFPAFEFKSTKLQENACHVLCGMLSQVW